MLGAVGIHYVGLRRRQVATNRNADFMSRSKKIFLLIGFLFLAGIAYFSYDVSSRTTFPGSKSQLKERIKKQFFEQDSIDGDSVRVPFKR